MPVLREPSPVRRKFPRWLAVVVLCLLLPPLALVLTIATSMLMRVQQWGPARLYQLPASAAYPPVSISGVSGVSKISYAPGRWMQQRLRVGTWILEWRWLPKR